MKRKRLLCKLALGVAGPALPLQPLEYYGGLTPFLELLEFERSACLGPGLAYPPPLSSHTLSLAPARCPSSSWGPNNSTPATGSQQQLKLKPPPSPHLAPHDLSSLRSGSHTPPTQTQDPLPLLGTPVAHPEDESVDQEDALETSNDWFSLHSPRRGRHD